MPRTPVLSFDRGTLILHPPPRGKAWIDFAVWDDRVERFRVPAWQYADLRAALQASGIIFEDRASQAESLGLAPKITLPPYPHQEEALAAWKDKAHRGVVVLPTAAGKTYLAQLAMQAIGRSTLIVVPTLDLMHQWYAHLVAAFPDEQVGLLGGGSRDRTPILVATYSSAAIQAAHLGDRYDLIVWDECHHLPSDFNRTIADYAIAPYRLGLTATPERSDGRHKDLPTLIGPEVYRRSSADLSGVALAAYEEVQIKVQLSAQERDRYAAHLRERNQFLQQANIWLGSPQGWQRFVQASARSQAGRRAMLAHRAAKTIAQGTEGKIRILADLLAEHYPDPTLIFTHDNATVYRISQDFLIPAITHQTPVKERHQILQAFRAGTYRCLVASHVLNEGVDVPAARIAIILSGTASQREFVQRLGRVLRKGDQPNKQAILYEVIAEETSEEHVAIRRRGSARSRQPTPQAASGNRQLSLYEGQQPANLPKVAEAPQTWAETKPDPTEPSRTSQDAE